MINKLLLYLTVTFLLIVKEFTSCKHYIYNQHKQKLISFVKVFQSIKSLIKIYKNYKAKKRLVNNNF